MKIKTSILQSLITQAVKGASHTNMLEITSMMLIEKKGGTLSLVTTDNANTLEVFKEVGGDGDFYAVVKIDQFSKLVAKTTTAEIELKVNTVDKTLEVNGNGNYVIMLPLDEESDLIEYPRVEGFDFDAKPLKEVEASKLAALPKTHANSIRVSNDVPFLNAYYFDSTNGVVTTNHANMTQTALNVFEQPTLLPTELVNLFELLDGKVKVLVQDIEGTTHYGFVGAGIKLHGYAKAGVTDFPIVQLAPLLKMAFPHYATVDQILLKSLLDRMTLFVGAYEENDTTLVFTQTDLIISDTTGKNVEEVAYGDAVEIDEPFSCVINAVTLKSFVGAQEVKNGIEIAFGLESSIMLIADGIQHIIGLRD